MYDLTNNVAIPNSKVSVIGNFLQTIISGNIYNNLPESEVDLAIRIGISNGSSVTAMTEVSYIEGIDASFLNWFDFYTL